MLKAVVTKYDGKKILVLGLSFENLKRLKQDKPIAFDGNEIGLQGYEVIIFSALNESLLESQFKSIFGNDENQRH